MSQLTDEAWDNTVATQKLYNRCMRRFGGSRPVLIEALRRATEDLKSAWAMLDEIEKIESASTDGRPDQ